MAKRRTARQRAASRRNLVKARKHRRKAMKYAAVGVGLLGARAAIKDEKRYRMYKKFEGPMFAEYGLSYGRRDYYADHGRRMKFTAHRMKTKVRARRLRKNPTNANFRSMYYG